MKTHWIAKIGAGIMLGLVLATAPDNAIARSSTRSAVIAGAEKSTVRTDTISVPEMQCGTCEATIRKALMKLKGIKAASPDANANIVVVQYDPRAITRAKIEKAIAAAGYDAGDARTTSALQNALPMCCRPHAEH